jgi:hypothetical protein
MIRPSFLGLRLLRDLENAGVEVEAKSDRDTVRM